MTEYLIRLFIMLPLVGGLAWLSLYLWKRLQFGLPIAAQQERAARVTEIVAMGVGCKLAVVEFRGQEILVGVSRSGMTLIAGSAKPQQEPVP